MKIPTSVRLPIFMTAANRYTYRLELYDFTRTLPHPDRALDEFAAAWQSEAPPQDTPWGRAVLQSAARRVQGALRLIEAALTAAARDETADRAYTAVLADGRKQTHAAGRPPARRGLGPRAGSAFAAEGMAPPGRDQRRAGRQPGGACGLRAARARQKTDPRNCRAISCCARGPNSRPTAAAPRRWWRRLCGRCACLPRPFLPPRSRKTSSTMPTMSTSPSICCRRRKGSARRCAPRSARAMRRCLSMNTRTPTPCRTRFIFRSPRPRPITSSSSATSSRASTASARPTPAFLPPNKRTGSPTRTRRRSRSRARPRSRWTPTSAAPWRSSRASTTSLRPFSPRRSAASPTAPASAWSSAGRGSTAACARSACWTAPTPRPMRRPLRSALPKCSARALPCAARTAPAPCAYGDFCILLARPWGLPAL